MINYKLNIEANDVVHYFSFMFKPNKGETMKTKLITMLLTIICSQAAFAMQIKQLNADDNNLLTWEPKPARFIVKKTVKAAEHYTGACKDKPSFDPSKSICSGNFFRTANCIVHSTYYSGSTSPNKKADMLLQAGEDYRILNFSDPDHVNPENMIGLSSFRSIHETEQEFKNRLANIDLNDPLSSDQTPFLRLVLSSVNIANMNYKYKSLVYVTCRNLTIDSDVEELQRELSGLFRIEK